MSRAQPTKCMTFGTWNELWHNRPDDVWKPCSNSTNIWANMCHLWQHHWLSEFPLHWQSHPSQWTWSTWLTASILVTIIACHHSMARKRFWDSVGSMSSHSMWTSFTVAERHWHCANCDWLFSSAFEGLQRLSCGHKVLRAMLLTTLRWPFLGSAWCFWAWRGCIWYWWVGHPVRRSWNSE